MEGLKEIFEQILESKEKVLRTVLKDRPVIYELGEEYAEEFMRKRKKNGIFVKSMRLYDSENSKSEDKETKHVDIKLDFSLLIWDDCVAIVDDGCTLIRDQKNADAMKVWFDKVWFT